MNTFYFDTGCTLTTSPAIHADQVWKGGTKHIPFDADAPESARLLFLCNDPDQPASKIPGVIVREVHNTSILSKYAYFKTNEVT